MLMFRIKIQNSPTKIFTQCKAAARTKRTGQSAGKNQQQRSCNLQGRKKGTSSGQVLSFIFYAIYINYELKKQVWQVRFS